MNPLKIAIGDKHEHGIVTGIYPSFITVKHRNGYEESFAPELTPNEIQPERMVFDTTMNEVKTWTEEDEEDLYAMRNTTDLTYDDIAEIFEVSSGKAVRSKVTRMSKTEKYKDIRVNENDKYCLQN